MERYARMVLDDIIDILSTRDGSLTDALLKTKIFLHQIGRKDLLTWLDNELAGYPDDDVPEYRIISTEVRGSLTSIAWQIADHQLPIGHLTPKQKKQLTSFAMASSIELVEEAIKSYRTKGGGMVRNLPIESTVLFQKMMEPGVNVIRAWCQVNMGDVENIISEVRARLLNFALELKEVVGDDTLTEMKKKGVPEEAGRIFEMTINGTGNNIYLANNSTQIVTITNKAGDIDGLVQALAKIGIPQDELDALRLAIGHDQSEGVKPVLGDSKTGHWAVKLIGRAANKGVDVGVDLVSSTIAKTIAAFNGMT
jgi:hypothetical protein